jgi:hypothetical protein
MAIEGTMQHFSKHLTDLTTQTGLLDVGLRTLRVSLITSTQPLRHLLSLSHSGILLHPTGLGTSKAINRLKETYALLKPIPMDTQAPRKIFEVGHHRVTAPDARAATALHLLQHSPKRLWYILRHGPRTTTGTTLPVYELITENGETLLANMNT